MLTLNKEYKIGFRAIKTAIAVFFCAVISSFVHHEDLFCSSIAAVICMEQTYTKTVETGINRFIGTIIGGIIGYIALELSLVIPYHELVRIFALPFCIVIVVYICNTINRKGSVSIGCVVLLVILSRLGQDTVSVFLYVVERVINTTIGIIVATIVNRFLFVKKYKEM
ncbi:MAG: aromatic acid exporter family protein [Oscillospiraceae bacterium]|jgi:uncharacterized membrane protein YgaE (UPF0421/DUF939 family)|nr:aromatic acid exporter family protein [Oscillospiraceae bacterium]